MNHKIDRDTYIIPPNFIESGTFFGGMFKARNVIEAGILAFAIGVPVFSLLPLGLTARIIALCLTALPAALVALIGISGESLSSFLLIFIKYLRNRRIVGGNSAEDAVPAAEHGGKHIKKKAHKPDKAPRRSRCSGREGFPAEFDEVRSYEIRQKLRPVKKQKPAKEKKAAKQKKKVSKERKVKRPIRTQEPKPACLNPVADYLPISKIENGIIYTKDHRYVKVVEVVPINFMLRSAQEQRNIIYSFVSYLKISPIKLQIKVLTRRAEINRHLDTVRKEMEQETNEQCLLMQEDYLQFVQQIGSREAITRRFFLIFEYEPWSNTKRSDEEALVRTYNTKGITHDNASLEDPAKPGQYREMPVLGDLYEILKTSKETMRMAHILNRLVNGSASTFNKQTNVRLDNKYTVLDISSLTGDLLTVGMFVALDFVWDRAKADRTEEKAIFIDECWQLLSGAGAAGVRLAGDFLLEIAKTIRGYGGASIFASQDLADFFDLDGGRFGKGIINNSKTKIILNLEDDEAQRVQEALHLSDAETMEITHFERGHGLISTNNNNIMVEFKASPLEKDLITTDRRELREIVERKRREQSTSAEQQI